MKHSTFEQKLVLFAGRDLPWWQNAWVGWHVKRCQKCQATLAQLQRWRRQVQERVQTQEPPSSLPDLWPGVIARITSPAPSRRARRTTRMPLLRPALALIAGLVAIFAIHRLEKNARERLIAQAGQNMSLAVQQNATPAFPVVEDVKMPNTTVLTFRTDDPRVTVVWFFSQGQENNIQQTLER